MSRFREVFFHPGIPKPFRRCFKKTSRTSKTASAPGQNSAAGEVMKRCPSSSVETVTPTRGGFVERHPRRPPGEPGGFCRFFFWVKVGGGFLGVVVFFCGRFKIRKKILEPEGVVQCKKGPKNLFRKTPFILRVKACYHKTLQFPNISTRCNTVCRTCCKTRGIAQL